MEKDKRNTVQYEKQKRAGKEKTLRHIQYDFSTIDFSQPPIQKALGRAYTLLISDTALQTPRRLIA